MDGVITDANIDVEAERLARQASLQHGGLEMSVWPFFDKLKKEAVGPIGRRKWRVWGAAARTVDELR